VLRDLPEEPEGGGEAEQKKSFVKTKNNVA
jgi:hypothetical protein